MVAPGRQGSSHGTARLMLVLLSIGWGFTWPMMKIALDEVPPLSMRVTTLGLGAATLALLVRLGGRPFALHDGKAIVHVCVAGILNVAAFALFTAFAQLNAMTSRVTIVVYSMPIWASLLAWPILGERFTLRRSLAVLLCAAGLAVLVGPLLGAGGPGGILLALGAAVSWAAGTVYLKWAEIKADPITVTFWQLMISVLVVAAVLPFAEGPPRVTQVSREAILSLLFVGMIGSGVAYYLWFDAVRRLPTMTASLGVLSVPLIGVVASIWLLGERPTLSDIIGFGLMLAASACVLLQQDGVPRIRREPA
jgi:drug/metabolite transporter (DMT)-like permease